MDPEKAAALIGTLPDDYVAQVFAQMSPDDVGPIMDNLLGQAGGSDRPEQPSSEFGVSAPIVKVAGPPNGAFCRFGPGLPYEERR